ncbi:hypothetical protein [Synechococcus sp. CCAP 1479/9]|uniref:hypothetical protein n=1 Tax=Synechococcus sp. CCAP 1479/9 TaxID=1221593 RepID=UPI001C24CCE4|nr:hypothetical protein [Synechococcus sp. CCAP 1479/9]
MGRIKVYKPQRNGAPICGYNHEQEPHLLADESEIVWLVDPAVYACWPRLLCRNQPAPFAPDPSPLYSCPLDRWLAGAERRGTVPIAATHDARGDLCRALFLRVDDVPAVLDGTWGHRYESADPATFRVGVAAPLAGSLPLPDRPPLPGHPPGAEADAGGRMG